MPSIIGNEVLCDDKWLQLRSMVVDHGDGNVSRYTYSHEVSCEGQKVSVLPFRSSESNGIEFLVRKEVTPAWGHSLGQHMSSITGGVEKDQNPLENAVMEVREEGGYDVELSDLLSLGVIHGSKSSDTDYYIFSVDLTNKTYNIPEGDGSYMETLSGCEWVSEQLLLENMVDAVGLAAFAKLRGVIL
jgi:8-oxo-dGTP pyrophosphatase MutT (NUDIX family)